IEKLLKELNDRYIFPETAKNMETDIRAKMKNKEYDSITSARDFSKKLTGDLRAVSRDKHLNVFFSFEPLPVQNPSQKPSEQEQRAEEFMLKINNYGFARAENLPGNIGYIDLRGFVYPQYGAETLAAAMNFVGNSDALIFDLRQNMGGEPEMVALICSYLFDAPVHLNDIYNRETGRTQEFWTQKTVAGKKFLGKNVYILTSGRTFSAAEEFTNDLKVLRRATIIGETTLGGANPGTMIRLTEHFQAYVPNERAINPVTKMNWEGTGIEPDIKVSQEQALKTACLLALNNSLEKADNEMMKNALKGLIEQNQKELDEIKKSAGVK
ncbi:MAG TPA: S41 family peptidase, partial [Pyrinomonadaceae bacterium]|nr:S41 family peptidase [Pyrinomonadaceae bacterium]